MFHALAFQWLTFQRTNSKCRAVGPQKYSLNILPTHKRPYFMKFAHYSFLNVQFYYFLLSCFQVLVPAARETKTSTGLMKGHAYSVTGVEQVSDPCDNLIIMSIPLISNSSPTLHFNIAFSIFLWGLTDPLGPQTNLWTFSDYVIFLNGRPRHQVKPNLQIQYS